MTKIQLRRGTAAQWTANNPLLASGEKGIETDTGLEKTGDGVNPWVTLPYFDTVISEVFVLPAPGTVFGTDIADETTALQTWLDSIPDYGIGVLPTPTAAYRITSPLTIDHPMTLWIGNAEIHQATGNVQGFLVTSDDVFFEAPQLRGPQFTVADNGRAIEFLGVSAANRIMRGGVHGGKIRSWGQYGVTAKFTDDIVIESVDVADINYGGIMIISCDNAKVNLNTVRNVVKAPEAYGIVFTNAELSTPADGPPCANFEAIGNTVDGVLNWTGIDCHGARKGKFAANTVTNCPFGILAGGSKIVGGAVFAAALDMLVVDNIVDSGVTDGSAVYGIAFVGAHGPGAAGTYVERSTGRVTGNTVRGYGSDRDAITPSVYLHDTQGVIVSDNTIVEASRTAILLSGDNYDFDLHDNTIVDPWSNAGVGDGVRIVGDFNTGKVGGNMFCRDGKVATSVMRASYVVQGNNPNTLVVFSQEGEYSQHTLGYADIQADGIARGPMFPTTSGVITPGPILAGATYTSAAIPVGLEAGRAEIGDAVVVYPPTNTAMPAGTVLSGRVDGTNGVTISISNVSASTVVPPPGTYKVQVIKRGPA